jgi:eukaryotic-like serine/threonine-protein kinase
VSDELEAVSAKLGDRYLIERELGRGGMGAVYLARDRRLDRPVALKVLPSEYAAVPELRERFLRETRLAAGFSHPNIVPVFAIEDTDDVLAFAMGLVEGESLASRVAREGPLTRRDAVKLLQDVSYALAYAHGRGVVHRDIKPDNIMIERATGRALVMDFGIARAITPVSEKPGLTRVGEVVGTPEYMSPEQAAGENIDGRADLYSLGLVAWFALAGRAAVTGETTQRILVKQLTEPIPPLATIRRDLPTALCDVVDRCCMKEADDRFANAEAVVEALDAAQLGTPDIPVAIRVLAPELGAITSRVLLATLLLAYGASQVAQRGNASVLSVGIIVAATAWVGGIATLQELRRLRRSGYSVEELQRVLRLVQAERDEARAARATDPVLLKRRRRRVIIASLILLWQLTTLFIMLRGLVKNGDVTLSTGLQKVTFFGALLTCALAGSILLSSPFRRTTSEHVFRALWLGRFGHGMLRLITRGRGSTTGGYTPPGVTPPRSAAVSFPTPAVVNAATTGGAATLASLVNDVTDLRARLDQLEARTQR